MLTEHTKEQLRQLQQHLRRHPQRFNMETWLESVEDFTGPQAVLEEREPPACNTVACLAGEYLIMNGQAKFSEEHNCFYFDFSVEDSAKDGLELSLTQAEKLFKFKSWKQWVQEGSGYAGWPKELEAEYYTAQSHAARAEVAIRRIDVFIDSEGEI